ncbi:alpha/beta hydrolase [Flavilitoribacter nigricans]|uniref:alpha/beta hydrolase n=1 Tax=Flavilitoribacter nigricans TaxID=70997 RepID=UPI001473FB16|nr:alpha/beta hydrolase [Flavilitoribacter nigricans]
MEKVKSLRLILAALFFMTLLAACQRGEKHIFYLHGRIIEDQGVNAVSEQFGPYRFHDIIDSLQATGAVFHYELRTPETDFNEFTARVSGQIDSLIAAGINPYNITVIGASKGAVMTMRISHLNTHPVNYVLLGANNDYVEREFDWTLHGRILGIYEASDELAGKNYRYWIERSAGTAHFEELLIETGLGHGFLYRPIDAWLVPAKNWMENQNHGSDH